MGVKLKLTLGIASLILGMSLLGGTFAIFTQEVKFGPEIIKAGKINLADNIADNLIFKIDNIVPGDTITRAFTLTNQGTIDISKVLIDLQYTTLEDGGGGGQIIDDGKNQLYDDLKATIYIDEVNIPSMTNISLKALRDLDPLDISTGGVAIGVTKNIKIVLNYNDTGNGNQNNQQGDGITMTFSFTAEQRAKQDSNFIYPPN